MIEINFDKRLVVKSNALIESKYHLSVREQKFLIYLASLCSKNDLDYPYTTVKIKDIERALKNDSKAKWGSIYEVVREIVEEINQKPLFLKKPNGSWRLINWFSEIEADTEKGIVIFELTRGIKEQLIQLGKLYTKYHFVNILALSGGYSIRIYELLKLNQFRNKVTYDLGYFRELIGVSFFDKKEKKWIYKYPEYKALKRSIIKYADKELREHTDIYFELKEHREGRKVKSLTFYVFKNIPKKKSNQTEIFVDKTVKEEVPSDKYLYTETILNGFYGLGMDKNSAKSFYIDGFSNIKDEDIRKKIVKDSRSLDEYFQEKIDYVTHSMSSSNVQNPVGLLIKATQEDYKSKEQERKRKLFQQSKKVKIQSQKKEIAHNQIRMMEEELFQKKQAIINNIINSDQFSLEEFLIDKNPELWIGFDKSKTVFENYFSHKKMNLFKAKVNSELEKAHPDLFNFLEAEKEKIVLAKKSSL